MRVSVHQTSRDLLREALRTALASAVVESGTDGRARLGSVSGECSVVCAAR